MKKGPVAHRLITIDSTVVLPLCLTTYYVCMSLKHHEWVPAVYTYMCLMLCACNNQEQSGSFFLKLFFPELHAIDCLISVI